MSQELTAAINRAFAKLPETPREIAEFLFERRIQGEISDSSGCPIAIYLAEEVPTDYSLNIDRFVVAVLLHPSFSQALFTVPLPALVRRFINNFDNGLYPNLERGSDSE